MKSKALQYYVLTAVILLGLTIYQMLHITGPVMYPDEFGYWANAAHWLGYDWSGAVSLQSYYSFGYSIFLIPFLKVIEDPSLMYKAAVLGNVLFVYLHAVMLWKVAEELREDGKEPSFFYCMTAAFYPSLIFYMQFTLTESLLSFLFLFVAWTLLKYIRQKKLVYGITAAVVFVYLYTVHMRTLGILLAGIFTMGYVLYLNSKKDKKNKQKNLLIIFLLIAGLLMFGGIIKELLKSEIYHDVNPIVFNVNDYAGQIDKISYLLSAEGFKKFLVSCIGKVFYIGLATGGTFYFGLLYLIKHYKKNPVNIFLILSIIFTFIITAIYTIQGGRGDLYIYGRYNEIFVPITIYLGLCEMASNRKLIGKVFILAVIQGGMACLLVAVMSEVNPTTFQGYFVVGISYALKELMPKIGAYIIYPYITGTTVMLLLALVMGVFIRKNRKLICYLCLLIGLFLYTAVSAGNKYIYDHSIDIGEDMDMADKVKSLIEPKDRLLFLNSPNAAQYIDIIQYCLAEYPIQVIEEKDFILENDNTADFVFTYRNSGQEEILKKYYDAEMETFHFKLYYSRR